MCISILFIWGPIPKPDLLLNGYSLRIQVSRVFTTQVLQQVTLPHYCLPLRSLIKQVLARTGLNLSLAGAVYHLQLKMFNCSCNN